MHAHHLETNKWTIGIIYGRCACDEKSGAYDEKP
jgi:hypothetical protein